MINYTVNVNSPLFYSPIIALMGIVYAFYLIGDVKIGTVIFGITVLVMAGLFVLTSFQVVPFFITYFNTIYSTMAITYSSKDWNQKISKMEVD